MSYSFVVTRFIGSAGRGLDESSHYKPITYLMRLSSDKVELTLIEQPPDDVAGVGDFQVE